MKKTLITIGALGVTAFAAYKLINKLNEELDRLEFEDDEDFYELAKQLGCCAECDGYCERECSFQKEAEAEAAKQIDSLTDIEKLLIADSLGIIDLNKINKVFHHPV